MRFTGDQTVLKQINRMALVRLVRRYAGSSRADLSQRTGLTKPAVGTLIKELVEEGWLREHAATATGAQGRVPMPLSLDAQRLCLVGVELAEEQATVIATSLLGEVLFAVSLAIGEDSASFVSALSNACDELLRLMTEQGRRVISVGLAVSKPNGLSGQPAHVHRASESSTDDVVRILSEAFSPVPSGVHVAHVSVCYALTHTEFSKQGFDEPLVFVYVGSGMFASLYFGERLRVGGDTGLGAIGHQQLDPNGPACSCGKKGCGNVLATPAAIAARCGISVAQLCKAAPSKQMRAFAMEAGAHLGLLLFHLSAFADPVRVVVSGPAFCCKEEYLAAARERFAARLTQVGLALPKLVWTDANEHSGALGAAALAMHEVVRPLAGLGPVSHAVRTSSR